jgi:hypothetical protein
MGTRNLICVKSKGKIKVAKYCQWDGYLAGQGLTILEFLKDEKKLNALRKNIDQCKFISQRQYNLKRVKLLGHTKKYITMPESDMLKKKLPTFHRDTGAEILNYIAKKPIETVNNIDFGGDGLFCEFAYIINLDTNKLEIFTGFHDKILGKNPFNKFNDKKESYKAVQRVAKINFNEIKNIIKPRFYLEKLEQKIQSRL